MKSISFLIKPASSACNMRCCYCFYADVAKRRAIPCHGVMTENVMQALVRQALAVGEDADITFAFQGGEPTLAGLSYYEAFIAYVEEHRRHQRVHYALQTNGLLLDEAWASFFHEHRFLIGVSLDGYAAVHDALRPDAMSKGTYARVMRGIQLLRQHQVEFNILTVLSAALAKHPQKLFSFYQKQRFSYVQLIPCLSDLEQREERYALQPKQFASFYQTFFDLWYRAYQQGAYSSVTLFDNLILMFAGIAPQQCGMLGQCAPQLVVESNGDVYPCDFYVLDAYRCGSIEQDTLDAILNSKVMQGFLQETKRVCGCCRDCPFEWMCHGNCRRQSVAYYTADTCGYRLFLEYAAPRLQQIARALYPSAFRIRSPRL